MTLTYNKPQVRLVSIFMSELGPCQTQNTKEPQ